MNSNGQAGWKETLDLSRSDTLAVTADGKIVKQEKGSSSSGELSYSDSQIPSG